MRQIIISIGGVIVLALGVLLGVSMYRGEDPLAGGLTNASCTPTVVSAVSIGNQVSTEIVATSSNRAYVIIQQPLNATNTVHLSFDRGAVATADNGIALANATTSGDRTYIDFGRATNFPYVSSVTGITDAGSTTVLVTECNY